jgi:ribosome maturation factor RimP
LSTFQLQDTVRAAVEPVLEGMGFSLIDIGIVRVKGSFKVTAVVWSPRGTGVEECGLVSQTLLPRLRMIEGLEQTGLEVSSPGIERTIKSPKEYAIFQGRGVRILAEEESDWIQGIIGKVENGVLQLETDTGTRTFALSGIRRARLDHEAEARIRNHAV